MVAKIELWTDGSHKNIDGRSVNGWGVVITGDSVKTKRYSGVKLIDHPNLKKTHYCICEFIAIFEGLKLLEYNGTISNLRIYTDSHDVINFFIDPLKFTAKFSQRKFKHLNLEEREFLSDFFCNLYCVTIGIGLVKSNFIKVKSHSGVKLNNKAHNLAYNQVINFNYADFLLKFPNKPIT